MLLVNGQGRNMGGKSLMREHCVLASVFSPVLGRKTGLRKLCDLQSGRSDRLRSMRVIDLPNRGSFVIKDLDRLRLLAQDEGKMH